MGELLPAPGMTQEQVLKTCVPCEKHPYISFLGYKAGENVFTYAEYSKEKAVDMLVLLRHITDYVIVDCTSVLTGMCWRRRRWRWRTMCCGYADAT